MLPPEPHPPAPTRASASSSADAALNCTRYLLQLVISSRPHPIPARETGQRIRLPSFLAAVRVPEIVIWLVTAEPAGITDAGLNAHASPEGKPEQARLTALLNPFDGVTVTVAVADVDFVSVPLAGVIESEKSGVGAEWSP